MKNISDIFNFIERSFLQVERISKDIIFHNAHNIDAALKLFSDEESRYLYAQEIVYCALSQTINPDWAAFYSGLMTSVEFKKYTDGMKNQRIFNLFRAPEIDNNNGIKCADMTATFLLEQYRYKDIVRAEAGDICLDGGAYIGDTAIYFSEVKPKKVYSFEIDRRNLEYLRSNIENFGKTDVVEIIDQALGSRCDEFFYIPMQGNSSGGHISELSEGEAYKVTATTIDKFCEDRGIIPNYIKLDIEGAEVEALIGAEKTIKNHFPKLAVCIYHRLSHHWEIPLLLHEFVPSYRFYLKKSQPYTETVLFAIR